MSDDVEEERRDGGKKQVIMLFAYPQ